VPIDPVCKTHVDIPTATASYDYQSETLYFCSLDCLREFEKDPGKYLGGMSDEELIAS
jgi:YHS domain-containing protein